MLRDFRLFQAAIRFYRLVKELDLPTHLRTHMLEASSSICLNISEGYGRIAPKDKRKFYRIALGSTRECSTILILADVRNQEILDAVDFLGAGLYKLAR